MKKSPLIVVTGASQGIGAAIARAFAAAFPAARLALVARNEAKLRAVARSCECGKAETFGCDVSDEASVATMAAAVKSALGTPDVLVNNAGKFFGAPLLATTVAQFDAQIAANLRSVFLVSRAFLPAMLARRSGTIYNMSSIAGLESYPNGAAYCAAKFGVTGLTAVMRDELKDKRIRVCCVHPGATVSPSWNGSGVPAKRMMPAEDLGRALVDIYRLGPRTVVESITLRPQLGDL